MNSAAAASLRRCRLASVLADRSELCLDHLLTRGFTDLNDTLVIFFTGLRNSKNMLTGGNIG